MELFQAFWFGEELPPYQQLAIKSFLDHGHRYALYAYRKFDVPPGTELMDAREILPASRIFFYAPQAGAGDRNIAGFSNVFRYHLLERRGGWWVDADVICLSGEVPSSDIFMGWEESAKIGNAILKLPAGHSFAMALREQAEAAGTDFSWGAIGPLLVTRLAHARAMLDAVAPQSLAYPVHYNDAVDLLLPAQREAIRQRIGKAPFLHYWNEMLRRLPVSLKRLPPGGSFMGDLFERHRIESAGEAYTEAELMRLAGR